MKLPEGKGMGLMPAAMGRKPVNCSVSASVLRGGNRAAKGAFGLRCSFCALCGTEGKVLGC